jgi:hypothetical protein
MSRTVVKAREWRSLAELMGENKEAVMGEGS